MPDAGLDYAEPDTCLVEAFLVGDFRVCGLTAEGVPQLSRKARALLAYLILLPTASISRERLATLLWGDRGEEQAKGSLRQTLHELRVLTAHAMSPFQITRNDVALLRDQIRTDVDRIRAAGECGDAARLVALLGRPPGILLSDLDDVSPSFDEWLVSEREQWRLQWRTFALVSARRVLARGGTGLAESLAKILIADDPVDEQVASLAMEVRHANGDRAGIHRVFQGLEASLLRDLNITPAAATLATRDRLMATALPDRPQPVWLQAPQIEPLDQVALTPGAPVVVADEMRDAPKPHRAPASKRRILLVLLLLLAFAVAVLAWLHYNAADRQVVFVEPFRASPNDAAAQALSAGLSAGLARVMVGTNTDLDVLDTSDASAKSRPADLVLGGNAITSNGRVYVTVRLSGGSPMTTVWSRDFSRGANDVDPLGRQIALSIGRELHFVFGNGSYRVLFRDPELLRLFLAGYDWVGKDFDEAARYFAQVVAKRPDFAPGWSAYAAAAAIAADTLPENARGQANAAAIHAAERAIAIDPHQGLAYYAMATTQTGMANWLKREALVRHGLDVDPMQPELNAMRGSDLMSIGRLHDALVYFRKSYAVDHFLPGKAFQLADALAETGDLGGAQDLIQQGYDLWPDIPWFRELDSKVAYHWGNPARAETLLEDPGASSESPSHMIAAEAFIAWRAHPSTATNDAAVAAVKAESGVVGSTPELVQALAALHHTDDAYRMAEKLSPSDGGRSNWFHDYLASFRADPRFIGLAGRLGLVSIWEKTGLWPDYCTDEKLTYECRRESRRVIWP